jgi:acetylornithine deacetylase/succinyl-diaminopimelate desuccinylase-like protein
MAYNPLHALVELLSKLRDQNGKITVPGFYDTVQEFNKNELKQIHFDFDAKKYEALYGGKATGGEKEFSPLERAWIRPTLEINGIHGGYGGSGFKTVIPAKAHAKISCRLVPNQDPHHIAELVAKFLKQNKPEGVDVHVNIHPGGGVALRANPDSKVIKAFAKAYEDVFETSCHYIFNGASIPIVSELAKTSGSEVVC